MKRNVNVLISAFVLVLAFWTVYAVSSMSQTGSTAQSKKATKPAVAENSKYGKYIITEPKPDKRPPEQRAEDAPPVPGMVQQMMLLDDEYMPGAFYAETSWILKAAPDKVWVKEHTHDFAEVFGLYGTDPKNPKDLGGEIELYIGGEKHTLTKSCVVFIPKGMKHCPLTIKRVDRPIFFFTTGPASIYKNYKEGRP